VEHTERNSFMPLSKVWVPMHLVSQNTQQLSIWYCGHLLHRILSNTSEECGKIWARATRV